LQRDRRCDFRDHVLHGSPKGMEYERICDRFEGEFFTVTLASPSFYLDLAAAKDAWMPAIESLVAGQADVTISAAMADAMDEVFEHSRAAAAAGCAKPSNANTPGSTRARTWARASIHRATPGEALPPRASVRGRLRAP
jgi:hypothetical protein